MSFDLDASGNSIGLVDMSSTASDSGMSSAFGGDGGVEMNGATTVGLFSPVLSSVSLSVVDPDLRVVLNVGGVKYVPVTCHWCSRSPFFKNLR